MGWGFLRWFPMSENNPILKPGLQELPRMQARITFLYLEHCRLSRSHYSITITDKDGIVYLPAASICTLLLGPGTSVTHQAIELIAEAGITIIWIGEKGVRYYASGRPLTSSSLMLIRQATLVSNVRSHMQVARKMYQMRFPKEDVSKMTMQQLRGREGSRIRQAYRNASREWGITWNGRDYKPDNYAAGDDVNKALSSGNACLYGLAHAVISALGCSAGLGFVHVGHENSFVYDIADLYKAEIVIPLAFEVAASHPKDIGSEMRKRVRDVMMDTHLLEKMVRDIRELFSDEVEDDNNISKDEVFLWDGTKDLLRNGFNYAEFDEVTNNGGTDSF